MKQYAWFLGIIGSFILFLLFVTFSQGYQQAFLSLNRYRFPFPNDLFVLITELGNGFWVCIFALALAIWQVRWWKMGLELVVMVLLTALIVQFCKQILFPHWNRPAGTFSAEVHWYSLLKPAPRRFSFPSGHSITVMSAAGVMVHYIQSSWGRIGLAVLSCGVAYTRIYVGAHFPADVAVGSILGLGLAFFLSPYLFARWRKVQWSANQEKKGLLILRILFVVVLLTGTYIIFKGEVG